MGFAMNSYDIARACYEAHREFHETISGHDDARPAWDELTEELRDEMERQVSARLRTPGLGVNLNSSQKDLIWFAVIHTLRKDLDDEAFMVSPLHMPQTA